MSRARLPFFPGRVYEGRPGGYGDALGLGNGWPGPDLAGRCAPTAQDRVRDYNDDGLHLYRHGSYAKAAESFEAALALEPGDPGLLFNAGQCYDHTGNPAKAEQYYTACLQKAPNHAGCRNALAALMLPRDGATRRRTWSKGG